MSQRFRARIAHWLGEAEKLSRGKARASNVRVAVCVRELGAQEVLVALRADEPHPPASNTKLVTTAAALILLGHEARWVTPFEANAPLADGQLTGDLVVRAAGDPLLDRGREGAVEQRLDEVGRALRAAIALHHFDAWRGGAESLFEDGAEFLAGAGVAVVEWADRVQTLLPRPRIELALRHQRPNERELDACLWCAPARSGAAAHALQGALRAALERTRSTPGLLILDARRSDRL